MGLLARKPLNHKLTHDKSHAQAELHENTSKTKQSKTFSPLVPSRCQAKRTALLKLSRLVQFLKPTNSHSLLLTVAAFQGRNDLYVTTSRAFFQASSYLPH